MSQRLTIAQAAPLLGMSERTLRRHAQAGKIAAVKTATESGTTWLIEPSALALKLNLSQQQEEEEEVPPSEVRVRGEEVRGEGAPSPSEEIEQLRREVGSIRAFLLGQALGEGNELPPNLGTVIGQALGETVGPLVERLEEQSAEIVRLQQQLADAAPPLRKRAWWKVWEKK